MLPERSGKQQQQQLSQSQPTRVADGVANSRRLDRVTWSKEQSWTKVATWQRLSCEMDINIGSNHWIYFGP